MNKHVRYTCNKKNEPIFEEDCKNCNEYNPCAKGNQWCFVGALVAEAENKNAREDVSMPLTENLASPVMRDMSTITINYGNGQSVDVLREDMKKAIESMQNDLYRSVYIGLKGGADQ